MYSNVSQTTEDKKSWKIPGSDYEVSIFWVFNQLNLFVFQQGETFYNVEEVYASQGVDGEAQDYFHVKMAISG